MPTNETVSYRTDTCTKYYLNHLIHKLKLYNIDTSWFSSYLNKRFQQTHYAGAISDKKGGNHFNSANITIKNNSGKLFFLSYVCSSPQITQQKTK